MSKKLKLLEKCNKENSSFTCNYIREILGINHSNNYKLCFGFKAEDIQLGGLATTNEITLWVMEEQEKYEMRIMMLLLYCEMYNIK